MLSLSLLNIVERLLYLMINSISHFLKTFFKLNNSKHAEDVFSHNLDDGIMFIAFKNLRPKESFAVY